MKKPVNWLILIAGIILYQILDLPSNQGFWMLSVVVLLAYGISWITQKKVSEELKPLVAPFSLQLSLMIIFSVSAFILGSFGLVAFDVLILIIGLAWLMARPGVGPVVLLSIYHIAGILLQIIIISTNGPVAGGIMVLLAHVLIRVASIYLMVTGLKAYRETKNTIPALTPADESEISG